MLHYVGIYTKQFKVCIRFFVGQEASEIDPGWSQLLGRTSAYDNQSCCITED